MSGDARPLLRRFLYQGEHVSSALESISTVGFGISALSVRVRLGPAVTCSRERAEEVTLSYPVVEGLATKVIEELGRSLAAGLKCLELLSAGLGYACVKLGENPVVEAVSGFSMDLRAFLASTHDRYIFVHHVYGAPKEPLGSASAIVGGVNVYIAFGPGGRAKVSANGSTANALYSQGEVDVLDCGIGERITRGAGVLVVVPSGLRIGGQRLVQLFLSDDGTVLPVFDSSQQTTLSPTA